MAETRSIATAWLLERERTAFGRLFHRLFSREVDRPADRRTSGMPRRTGAWRAIRIASSFWAAAAIVVSIAAT